MKEKLNSIRMPQQSTTTKTVISSLGTFVLGIVLGIISKWLDNLALDSTIWWHRILETLDLNNFFSEIAIWLLIALVIAVCSTSAFRAAVNVFAFFAGMCGAYHLYTVLFSGFNPSSYMMIWYGITLFSPVLAVLCWYAKGEGVVSIILDIGIFAVFTLSCFSVGIIYVYINGILNLLVFAIVIIVMYNSPKQLAISLPIGLLLSFLLSPIWPYK